MAAFQTLVKHVLNMNVLLARTSDICQSTEKLFFFYSEVFFATKPNLKVVYFSWLMTGENYISNRNVLGCQFSFCLIIC